MSYKSICHKCSHPGLCCERFILTGEEPWAFTAIENKKKVISRLKAAKLPFKTVSKGKKYWVFGCKNLLNSQTVYLCRLS